MHPNNCNWSCTCGQHETHRPRYFFFFLYMIWSVPPSQCTCMSCMRCSVIIFVCSESRQTEKYESRSPLLSNRWRVPCECHTMIPTSCACTRELDRCWSGDNHSAAGWVVTEGRTGNSSSSRLDFSSRYLSLPLLFRHKQVKHARSVVW